MFGLLGFNVSATARVISRFGLLGLNASATARVISNVWFVRALMSHLSNSQGHIEVWFVRA